MELLKQIKAGNPQIIKIREDAIFQSGTNNVSSFKLEVDI